MSPLASAVQWGYSEYISKERAKETTMEFTATTAQPKNGVAEVRYQTPKTAATRIARQDDETAWVYCECGCGNVITVGKREWRPVSFADLNGPEIEIRLTAAPRRICGACIAKAAKAANR